MLRHRYIHSLDEGPRLFNVRTLYNFLAVFGKFHTVLFICQSASTIDIAK